MGFLPPILVSCTENHYYLLDHVILTKTPWIISGLKRKRRMEFVFPKQTDTKSAVVISVACTLDTSEDVHLLPEIYTHTKIKQCQLGRLRTAQAIVVAIHKGSS